MPAQYDWHFQHNLDLLASSRQYLGQIKQASALLKESFDLPSNLVVQVYNKREWPGFLRGARTIRGGRGGGAAADRSPPPAGAGRRPHRGRPRVSRRGRWGDAATAVELGVEDPAQRGGRRPIAAPALLGAAGRDLRSAPPTGKRDAGVLLDAAARVARAARARRMGAGALRARSDGAAARDKSATGSWPGQLAQQMLAHDP